MTADGSRTTLAHTRLFVGLGFCFPAPFFPITASAVLLCLPTVYTAATSAIRLRLLFSPLDSRVFSL